MSRKIKKQTIKNRNSIKRRKNIKNRKRAWKLLWKEYLSKRELDYYYKNNKNNLVKKWYYWTYWELYKKMWLRVNIDLDKISESFKKYIFINKDDIYEYEDKEVLINKIISNKNFLNNQNYIIWKTEKKRVFSVSYWRELTFIIADKFFNIRLFFAILSLLIFWIFINFSFSYIYLFISIIIFVLTAYLKLNSKYNVLSTFQTKNNFVYLKKVFMFWTLSLLGIILLFPLLWIIISIFPDSYILYYENFWNSVFEKYFFPLVWVFATLIFTRLLFKLNIFHIIFSPFFLLLRVIMNLDYFINYEKYSKKVLKLELKKIWYSFSKQNFLKRDKDWNFINEGYLIKK